MAPTVVNDAPETASDGETRGTMKRRGLIAGAAALAAGILAAKAQPADAANGQPLVGGQLNGAGLSTGLTWDAAGGPLNLPVQLYVTDINTVDTSFAANIQGFASGTAHTATPVPITTGVYGYTTQAAGYGTAAINAAGSANAIATRGFAVQGFGAFFSTNGSTLNNGSAGDGVQGKGPRGVSGYGINAGTPVGVFGSGDNTATGTVGIGVNAYGANGVSGQANSDNGIGVVGTSLGVGGGVTGVSAGSGRRGPRASRRGQMASARRGLGAAPTALACRA